MSLHDGAADGQAQSGAADVVRFPTVEFFENTFFLAGRNSGAAVSDFDDDGVIFFEGCNLEG